MSGIAVSDVEETKSMKAINLIFPHQLFEASPLLENGHKIYLLEEYLFFKQYKFHKQKIAFHRATMKAYCLYLEDLGKSVEYIDSGTKLSDIRNLKEHISKNNIKEVHVIDPTDDWLEQRLEDITENCELITFANPQFLNTRKDLDKFFRKDKKSYFQTTFYKQQRRRFNILIDKDENPTGDKWTFDSENRKRYPRDKTPPAIHYPESGKLWDEAVDYVNSYFAENPGSLSGERLYPVSHKEVNEWFDQFLIHRFHDFGTYEDAIVKEALLLNHSLLSPLMNTGLLLPGEVVDRALEFAKNEDVPINSTEGFIRQIIGWREFIRGMYMAKGRFSRTRNFWDFERKIPASFYDGTTGIEPIDLTIKKVLKTGYCHHIERLMVLGNFMLLCEFDPDEVYRWFMELFIDAYDWVMVPNVYGMCLFADGGTFATKPYISGSNYLRKMSNYGSGDWEKTWDGLFWRFIMKHQEFFTKNPRTSMLVRTLEHMTEEKRNTHLANGEKFLQSLSKRQ